MSQSRKKEMRKRIMSNHVNQMGGFEEYILKYTKFIRDLKSH